MTNIHISLSRAFLNNDHIPITYAHGIIAAYKAAIHEVDMLLSIIDSPELDYRALRGAMGVLYAYRSNMKYPRNSELLIAHNHTFTNDTPNLALIRASLVVSAKKNGYWLSENK